MALNRHASLIDLASALRRYNQSSSDSTIAVFLPQSRPSQLSNPSVGPQIQGTTWKRAVYSASRSLNGLAVPARALLVCISPEHW